MINSEYLIYCRKSIEEVDNQKNSLEVQEQEGIKFAKSKGLKITSKTIDGLMKSGVIKESHSAFKTKALKIGKDGLMEYQIERPKFMQMIGLLIEKKYKGVIVLCWDRISRNEQDDMIVKELIDNHGIDIQFVQTQYDKGIGGDLHRDIDGMFARHYSKTISVKVKTTFDKLIKEKRCLNVSPIGYLDKGSDNKPVDPERGSIVKDLLNEFVLGGHSIDSLLKVALKKGLTQKPRKKKGDKSGIKVAPPVTRRAIESMLNSQFYIGRVRFRGEWREGKHTPLIDMRTYIKNQEHLKSNRTSIKYDDLKFFPYRGIIKCTCGRSYSPELKKDKYVLYTSKCKKDCDNSKKCLNEKDIDNIISELITKLSFSKTELERIRKEFETDIDSVAKQRNEKLHKMTKDKEKLFDELDFLKKNKLKFIKEGFYTIESYIAEENKLKEEMTKIDKMFQIQTETEIEMLNFVTEFSELVQMTSELYKKGTDKERKELCNLIFSELTIKDGSVAGYRADEGFDELLSRTDKKPPQSPGDSGDTPFSGNDDIPNGGETGIRTLGNLRYNGFQDRRFQPLSHLSY